MKKYPNLICASELKNWDCQAHISGKWVIARPLGDPSFFSRLRLAWLVFIGKADALVWPENQ
jgi:hypothetical protein